MSTTNATTTVNYHQQVEKSQAPWRLQSKSISKTSSVRHSQSLEGIDLCEKPKQANANTQR